MGMKRNNEEPPSRVLETRADTTSKSNSEEKEEPSEAGGVPQRRTVQIPYTIDLPSQETLAYQIDKALPAGRPVLVESRETGNREGRMLFVAVEIQPAMGERR